MTDDIEGTETALSEVLEVLAALSALCALGCRFWLEGGRGVDALVGRQTRPHRDVDVDLEARCEEAALAVLAGIGYTVETDWRPNRVELNAPGRGRVDLHPLLVDEDGTARQGSARRGFHVFPPSFFVTGSLAGVPVPCVPSPRSVCSTPGMSYEVSISTISLSSTSWTAATGGGTALSACSDFCLIRWAR
jgi:lincosamide nucleotidyltransferase A/C/D/E